MKKLIAVILSIAVVISLVGCSKKGADKPVTVNFTGSSFTVDGKDLGLYMYQGYQARANVDGEEIEIFLEQVDDLSYAQYNYDQIIVDNMDIYKDKAYTWTMYLGRQKVLYYPYSGTLDTGLYWVASTANGGALETQGIQYLWDICSQIAMTEKQVIVECGDDVTFTSSYDLCKVTNEYASIPDTCNIKRATKPECTEPYTIVQNEKETITLYKYDSDRYSYYQYGDWLIQTILGLDLTEYFTFHASAN